MPEHPPRRIHGVTMASFPHDPHTWVHVPPLALLTGSSTCLSTRLCAPRVHPSRICPPRVPLQACTCPYITRPPTWHLSCPPQGEGVGCKSLVGHGVRKHLTKGFPCAVSDLSGTLWPLLIPEYSGIKRRGTPFLGLRNPGISH